MLVIDYVITRPIWQSYFDGDPDPSSLTSVTGAIREFDGGFEGVCRDEPLYSNSYLLEIILEDQGTFSGDTRALRDANCQDFERARRSGVMAELQVDQDGQIWSLQIDDRSFYSYDDRVTATRQNAIVSIVPIIVVSLLLVLQSFTSGLSKLLPDTSSMSLRQLYFSTNGEISRSVYWVYALIPFGLYHYSLLALNNVVWGLDLDEGIHPSVILLMSIVWWPVVAMGMKRCRDRGRSVAFFWLHLIPVLNLWPMFELAFLDGGQARSSRQGRDVIIDLSKDPSVFSILSSGASTRRYELPDTCPRAPTPARDARNPPPSTLWFKSSS